MKQDASHNADHLLQDRRLVTAQERLIAQRRALHAHRNLSAPQTASTSQELNQPNKASGPECAPLPDHLGWHSAAFSQLIRRPNHDGDKSERAKRSSLGTRSAVTSSAETSNPTTARTIPIPPTLARTLLKQERTADGRVWLLLRHLDSQGRGWHTREFATKQLAGKESEWRICGKRQLRNLLRRGNGLFWVLDRDRIWLRSQARVAHALGLRRMEKHSVSLTPADLTGSIGPVRAHLYAAFHSKRDARPISRASIQAVTGASRSSQRNYERAAGVRIRPNYALLAPITTPIDTKEAAWRYGRACFELTDHKGRHGKPGTRYMARQLPNSYHSPQTTQRTGSSRRVNRTLRDLLQLGTTGNGTATIERIYCNTVQEALRGAVNRSELYWKSTQATVWYAVRPEILCTG